MTDMPTGWYDAEHGGPGWWDGSAWTVHDGGVPDPAPPVPVIPPLPRLAAGSTTTTAVWLVALSPVMPVAINAASVLAGGGTTYLLLFSTIVITTLAVLALTEWDRHQLLERGYTEVASPLWTLLTPLAYLIVRGNRVYRRSAEGMTPMWGHVAVIFVLLLLAFGVMILGNLPSYL